MNHPDALNSVGLSCNPHSTTSPRASPQLDLLNSSSQQSSHQDDDISVTASSKGTPPPDDRPGAFTTVLSKSKSEDLSLFLNKKHEFMQKNHELSSFFHNKGQDINNFFHNSGQHGGHAQGNLFNNALAAQLFLNTPLLQPPNQWLYSQLYQGGYDWPWLQMRHPSLMPSNPRISSASPDTIRVEDSSQESTKREELTTETPTEITKSSSSRSEMPPAHKGSTVNGINLSKKKTSDKKETESSGVSSSKRSSSPLAASGRIKSGDRNTTTRHSDVWRPY